jgi:hypothetical protein
MSFLFNIRERLAIFASLFFFVTGIIVILVSLLFHLNKAHIGLAFALPPFAYMALRKKNQNNLYASAHRAYRLSRVTFIFSTIVFVSTISSSLFCWYAQIYQRPIVFFVLIAVAYLTIMNQILFFHSRKYTYLLFLEILAVAIILRGSVYFNFPTVYGYDPIFHMNGLEQTVSSGFLSPQLETYTSFPYMTLLDATISQVLGINLRIAYFGISVIEAMSCLFIFVIGRMVANEKIGLLSAAIVTILPYSIYWGVWIIPMTLGLNIFVIIAYLMIKKTFSCPRRNTALLIFFLLSLILVHSVASFITGVLLLVIFVSQRVYNTLFSPSRSPQIVTPSLIVLFGSALFSYWMFVITKQGTDFFSVMTGSLATSLRGSETTAVTTAPSQSYLSVFLCDLPLITSLFLGILGLLFLLRNKISSLKFALAFSSIFLVFLIYGTGFLGISAILPDRWFVFMEFLLVLFVAYGVYMLVSSLKSFRGQFFLSCTILFVLIFSAITSPIANGDSAFYAEELSGRAAFKQSEVNAATFVNTHYEGLLSRSARYLLITGKWVWLNPKDPTTYDDQMVILRNYDIEKGFTIPRFGYGGKSDETLYPDQQFYDNISRYNKIYENGEVRAYLPP